MNPTVRKARRVAGMVKRELFPRPEVAAWQHAWALAQSTPRFTPGEIQLMDYRIKYLDLMSVCPGFHDIFVQDAVDFHSASPAPRILDCGANIGLASLFFRRRYPQARITAYEADPALCALLAENLRANRAPDVEVVNAALWTTTGEIAFQCEGGDSGMVSGLPGAAPGPTVAVPALRLRDILASEVVDLLKLDIEGGEDAVLADCEPVLDRVRALVLDLHEFNPDDRQAPRVLERLTRAGFAYAVDELVAQPWRPPVAADDSPFPGRALIWSMNVRAWRTQA
jgi:FkbM family methyltransferase